MVVRRSSDITVPLTGFGETSVAANEAFIQAAPVYDLVPANFRTFTNASGSAGAENRMFKVSTGTSQGGYGAVQSFRAINYKAGEAGMARFTALFEGNAAGSEQGAGLLALGDELSFGYSGTAFGIWHRRGGLAEVRTITITTPSSGSTDLTLTLNGTAYTIPLTSGTVQHNAWEITDWLNDTANQGVWRADQLDDTVIIAAQSDGAKDGSYSFSHATAAGSIVQNKAGVTKTSTHVAQDDWNGKAISVDPTKGNVYQIQYQYLGFGDIKFFIEDRESGQFVLVHTIKYANSNTSPSVGNPSLRLGIYAVNFTNTTDLIARSASMAGFVQGKQNRTRNPRSATVTQSVTTTNSTIIALRNRRTYNGYYNQVEINPDKITIANDASKNVTVEIRATANPDIELNYQSAGTNLIADISEANVAATTGGRLLDSAVLPPDSQFTFDLQKLAVRMPPTLHLIVQAKQNSGGASADLNATITWYEDL